MQTMSLKAVDVMAGPQANAEDHDWIQASLAGDQAAFSALVSKYRGLVYGVAYRYVGNHAEADDLAQETFLKAYENLASFRGEAAFKSWLLRITTNLAINTRKSGRVSKDSGLQPSEEMRREDAESEHLLMEGERAKALHAAIARLPERQRQALVLKSLQELSCEEVAKIMKCSVGSVKANVFNAVKKLRDWLGSEVTP